MAVISAEISEDGKRVRVNFRFDWQVIKDMNTVPGARFVGKADVKQDDVPHWILPLDLESLRLFRRTFDGHDLRLGNRLKAWGREQTRRSKKLRSIALADHAELVELWNVAPRLARALFIGPLGKGKTEAELTTMKAEMLAGTIDLKFLTHLPPELLPSLVQSMRKGSYQQADTAFMSLAGDDGKIPHSPANFNHPGTGKTLEIIGAVLEAGMPPNSVNLVCAPKTSLESVWAEHLRTWQHLPVLVAGEGRAARDAMFHTARVMYQNDDGFWMVVNPEVIRQRRHWDTIAQEEVLLPTFPFIYEIQWNWFVIDEFHLMGLGNTSTLSYKSFRQVHSDRRMATSGTPIGGKAEKIFGILQFLRPDVFTSRWRFAEQWFDIFENDEGFKNIGDVREDRQDEFYQMLAQYAVRRTKDEVLPWLPPKDYIDLWCVMDGKQRKQYEAFAEAAEIKIEEEHLSATSIMAEYTRLKQFAFAACNLEARRDGTMRLIPIVETSAKLAPMLNVLEELGIAGSQIGGDEKVVIFSQFREVIDAVETYLLAKGVSVSKITGKVNSADARKVLIKAFQEEAEPRVMVMTTSSGGVSITLDRASTVIFLDETWTPDDQEQGEDRCHRGSRVHQVRVYYFRTKGTVEHEIWEVNEHKRHVNFSILDARRRGLRASRKAS